MNGCGHLDVRLGRWCLALGAVSIAILTGCSGAGLDADSTCRDFLNASVDEQNALVSQVAAEIGAANAVTPLGRPNVDYLCVQSPDMAVGEAIQLTG